MSRITLHGVEDEMLTFHQGGKYLETLYASCPEQARDFEAANKGRTFQNSNALLSAFTHFKATWRSKYTDEYT